MSTKEMVVDVSQDWVLACHVQQGFMQASCTSSSPFDFAARCRQVRALGGDCYSLVPLDHDRFALFIGDASGKGLPAALMIANVQSSLQTAALFTADDLATMVKAVNRQVCASSSDDRYATLFYGVFHAPTRILRYVNAGHTPPVLIRRDGSMQCLETGGPPVGLFADSEYEVGSLGLEADDMVIAFTDGLIEATNQKGEEWGLHALLNAVACQAQRYQHSADLVDSIFDSLDAFSNEHQTDDVTLTVVRVM